jgi:hypothetical protein
MKAGFKMVDTTTELRDKIDRPHRGPTEIIATMGRQNDYRYCVTVLTVGDMLDLVEEPDPTKPLAQNRLVEASRAHKYADYVLNNSRVTGGNWTCPPLTVRVDPNVLNPLETIQDFGDNTQIVKITVPRTVNFHILDGQHRALGFEYARARCNENVLEAAQLLSSAQKNKEPASVVAQHQKSLEDWKELHETVMASGVPITIALVDAEAGNQMFVDIATNAKGVNPDFTRVLDQREVVNRIGVHLVDHHPLLIGRVEKGQSKRMSSSNPNLVGAKTVTDMVRHVFAGTGRVSRRLNDEITARETAAISEVSEFLDGLVASFTGIKMLVNGSKKPLEFRAERFLASATMLRALAIVWHQLISKGKRPGEIEEFFKKLDPHMAFAEFQATDPVTGDPVFDDEGLPVMVRGVDPNGKLWWKTGVFLKPGSQAPSARQGDITSLTDQIVGWALNGHPGLG